MSGGNPPDSTSLRSPRLFGLMVVAVLFITVVSFIAILILPFLASEPPTELQRTALTACDFGFKSGLGALAGLFGGKVSS